MALVNITSTPVEVTIPGGTPVTVSDACTLGFTEAGAASGPTVTGTFTWPGRPNANLGSPVILWVQTQSTATLNYLS